MLKYISPSSLNCFYYDRQEFYLRYMAKVRTREPATWQMKRGLSFDVWVKKQLGWTGETDETDETDWSDKYSVTDIQLMLQGATFGMEEMIDFQFRGIPLKCKPDLWAKWEDGTRLILDWKVNSGSPTQGYLGHKGRWGVRVPHIGFVREINPKWIDQLALYNIAVNRDADPFYGIIEQLAVRQKVKSVRHAGLIHCDETWRRVEEMWEICQSDNIFVGTCYEGLTHEELDCGFDRSGIFGRLT